MEPKNVGERENGEPSRTGLSRKCKAKDIVDNPRKESMEEELLEEELMEEDFPPRKDLNAEEEEENFSHHVQPSRGDVELVTLPMEALTFLVAPRIPDHIPLLMDIM